METTACMMLFVGVMCVLDCCYAMPYYGQEPETEERTHFLLKKKQQKIKCLLNELEGRQERTLNFIACELGLTGGGGGGGGGDGGGGGISDLLGGLGSIGSGLGGGVGDIGSGVGDIGSGIGGAVGEVGSGIGGALGGIGSAFGGSRGIRPQRYLRPLYRALRPIYRFF